MAASTALATDTSAPHGRERGGARRVLLAFGFDLARRGVLAGFAKGVVALTVLIFVALGLSYGVRGGDRPTHTLPLLASSAIAWGGAFCHAVVASVRGFRRDREEGIFDLLRSRGVSIRGYAFARIGGLAGVLAAEVVLGTALVSLAALAVSSSTHGVGRTAETALASLLFGLAFAAVMAPVALAVLGVRARASGYFVLLLVVVVPELLVHALSTFLPSELAELCAIPSALAALRGALLPGSVNVLRLLRAALALALMASVASVASLREIAWLESEGS